MTNSKWIECQACDGQGQVEHWGDRFDEAAGVHGTWHSTGPCDRCDGNGEIQVEVEPVEPILNDHPDFTQVFWWKPIAPPEYAATGPFLDSAVALGKRRLAGGQLETIPRADGSTRPCYVASDAALMRRWPRVIAAIAHMNDLYTDEATYALRNYLNGHDSVEMGFFGKRPSELVRGAIAVYFTSWKEGIHEEFLKRSMEDSAKCRRGRCQEMAQLVRSKVEARIN